MRCFIINQILYNSIIVFTFYRIMVFLLFMFFINYRNSTENSCDVYIYIYIVYDFEMIYVIYNERYVLNNYRRKNLLGQSY